MRDLEASIVQSGTELLRSHAERLAACGRTWQGPDIEIWESQPNRYTSEVRITIFKKGGIDDVLEFHVYDGGQALVTLEEALKWLDDQLQEIENLR